MNNERIFIKRLLFTRIVIITFGFCLLMLSVHAMDNAEPRERVPMLEYLSLKTIVRQLEQGHLTLQDIRSTRAGSLSLLFSLIVKEYLNNPRFLHDGRNLILSCRNLSSITGIAAIPEIENVRTLNLSANDLTSLPAEIGNLTNLRKLTLSCNRLTTLPAEIGKLTNLRKLTLSNNQLERLPAKIGDMTNLLKLYISFNKLISLPTEIGNLTELLSLGLCNNELTSLPVEIGNLTKLRVLDLNNNELPSLPAEIGSLRQLRALSFKDNPIISVPREIRNLAILGTEEKKLARYNFCSLS